MGRTAVAVDDHCYDKILDEKRRLEDVAKQQGSAKKTRTMGQALHSLLKRLDKLENNEGTQGAEEEKIIEVDVDAETFG